MSARKTIFPPRTGQEPKPNQQSSSDSFFDEEDLYTGQPSFAGQEPPTPESEAPLRGTSRGAAKGHAAYSSASNRQEEMPPHAPRDAGLGSLGGLFTPEGEATVDHAPDAALPDGGGLLALVTDDALMAECQKRVCPACPVKKEADAVRLRALADLDNAKKRLAREREEQVRFAAEAVLADIIPSLDNLDLALRHADNLAACKDFVVGVDMTRKLMLEALAKHGLQQAGEVGEEFNPAVHEAVGMVDAPDQPDGHVCVLLSKGYRLHDRLLRPAKVMVCKKS